MKKAVLVSEILPSIIEEIVNNSIENDKTNGTNDRLNSPIERVRSKEISRISARKRCLEKVKNL